MPALTHPTVAARLWTCLVGRSQLIGRTVVRKGHQARAARPVPQESRLPALRHARKAAAPPATPPPNHPATPRPGIPYNPLYDLPALPPFQSAEASLCTGKHAVMVSAQASAALAATRRRLWPLLEVSQRPQLTTERLIEVGLLMSAADVQAHGADSQIVKILGHQVTNQPAHREKRED
jgi:hypothetical protein